MCACVFAKCGSRSTRVRLDLRVFLFFSFFLLMLFLTGGRGPARLGSDAGFVNEWQARCVVDFLDSLRADGGDGGCAVNCR